MYIRWLSTLSALLLHAILAQGMTDDAIASLRQETRDIFYHGYNGYMKFAFPEDELRPLLCKPLTRNDSNPAHVELNDPLGNYSVTLIDTLSTLAILASSPSPSKDGRNRELNDFQDAISALVLLYGDGTKGRDGQGLRSRGFDVDSKVQVFETTIRGVGGLLSAHLFAIGELPIRGYDATREEKNGREGIFWKNGMVYDGQLLRLALDLATRLLPAFSTPTGIPYPRVNLRRGIPFYANSPLNTDAEIGQCLVDDKEPADTTETCAAGSGSLVLEFATLSRLTGDDRFERLAKRAFWAIWERRSSAGLIGSSIDAETGQWISPVTGIGAGIDSFFEYAFKSQIFFSGVPYDPANYSTESAESFGEAWQDVHASIKRHIYRGPSFQHPHYIQVDLHTGAMRAFWLDSLAAFYPGLLAFAGELDEAIESHLLYSALWTRFSSLPERWSTATGNIEHGLTWWPGRPEFIESTWYIYRATKDPWYLYVAEMVMRDLKRRCWTRCGWAGLQDVRSGQQSDRMESFFLGETVKYLHLLFDETHPLNHLDKPFVFSTEGHPLILPERFRQKSRPTPVSKNTDTTDVIAAPMVPQSVSQAICPRAPSPVPFSISATAARQDLFHAASLVRLHLMPKIGIAESPILEFTNDHPSISQSDLVSPTNYTYYPWTLPLQFVPTNATSSKLAARNTFDLSFPTLPNMVMNAAALQRSAEGILVNSVSGLRLGMVRELSPNSPSDLSPGEFFRIYAVSNVALGRDEKVFLSENSINGFNPIDPHFSKIRDMEMFDLVLDVPITEKDLDSAVDNNGVVEQSLLQIASQLFSSAVPKNPSNDDDGSTLMSSLLQGLQDVRSLFSDFNASTSSSTPSSQSRPVPHPVIRTLIPAILPVGPGAAPLPPVTDATADLDLDWSTIYVAASFSNTTTEDDGGDDDDGTLCNRPLPASVVKSHQVLVIKRGRCSFSDKLRNIPAFAPSPTSLQLVIVVSYPEHQDNGGGGSSMMEDEEVVVEDGRAGLVRPLLEQMQRTPAGVPRPHPLSMAMVGGGDETWEMLARAKGIGVKRRYHFVSQGLRISNLFAL
ncbi:MAG: alpha mannosidase-like protein [Bathelium mastoideum]|nr:MAG: alpha mannosidase-like protein [Bathelium mastoideum]